MVEEKRCPVCGARMNEYRTTENGKPVTKRVCSMGKLCERARTLRRETARMDQGSAEKGARAI